MNNKYCRRINCSGFVNSEIELGDFADESVSLIVVYESNKLPLDATEKGYAPAEFLPYIVRENFAVDPVIPCIHVLSELTEQQINLGWGSPKRLPPLNK